MRCWRFNNNQYPIYCKLHGDFQYDGIKNLASDLATQNEELSNCMAMADGRFGLVVAGYSGRVESIMALFRAVPAGTQSIPARPLLDEDEGGCRRLAASLHSKRDAKAAGIRVEFADIDTYDTVMLRLWRDLPYIPDEHDEKVREGWVGSSDHGTNLGG